MKRFIIQQIENGWTVENGIGTYFYSEIEMCFLDIKRQVPKKVVKPLVRLSKEEQTDLEDFLKTNELR